MIWAFCLLSDILGHRRAIRAGTMTHWFTLILDDTEGVFDLESDEEFDEALGRMADELFEAGCDDGTFGCSERVFSVGFAREAGSLEEAVRSAIADVQSAGCRVRQVTVETPPELDEINAQLAEGRS
jgi:hypothetical protein